MKLFYSGIFITIFLAGIIIYIVINYNKPLTVYVDKNITVEIEKIVYREPTGVIASITMTDLHKHLQSTYKGLSSAQRTTILTSIAKTSDKYKISPIIIYGLIAVESSFRPWVTHKQVTIKGK